jgi:hypothetical protein
MKPIKQVKPRSEVIDWAIFIAILTALAFANGCGPRDIPSPSPMTKGAIAATDKSLDQAKSNLDKNDVPAAKGNIGDAKKSNSQAAIGHDATVKWYEVKVKERDDAIVDRDKVIEKDHKTLDKWYVKAVIAIAELIKWIIGISVFIGILKTNGSQKGKRRMKYLAAVIALSLSGCSVIQSVEAVHFRIGHDVTYRP